MTFFVIAGAISFCVFITMYLDNMLASVIRRGRWVLLAFVGVYGIILRSVPWLNSIAAVVLISAVVAIPIGIKHKNTLKCAILAVFLVALLFGTEGLTLLLSRLMGHEPESIFLTPLYLGVIFVVFALSLLINSFFEKLIWKDVLNHRVIRFLLVSAGVALVFILKNFAIDGAGITLGQWTADFGDIAFMLFFASGAAMVVIILRFVSLETALRAEMLLVEASKKYVHDLEESYKALRTIKHDYVNILTSFKLYIDSKDTEGLTAYYYNELSEINRDLLRQDQLMGSLQNIQISEVKSILIYKCSKAVQHEILTDVEAKELIESLGISTAIICQMLGILLDNAIEAALETEEKKLQVAVVNNPTSKVFIIKNTWNKQDISTNKLFEYGFTTKTEGRGMGLHTARRYTDKTKNLFLETEITDEFFTQILTVKDY